MAKTPILIFLIATCFIFNLTQAAPKKSQPKAIKKETAKEMIKEPSKEPVKAPVKESEKETPPTESKPPPPTKSKKKRTLYGGIRAGFSRFDMQDNFDGSQGTFVSKVSTGVDAIGTLEYSEKLTLLVLGQYRFLILEAPENTAFAKSNITTFGLGLGGRYLLNPTQTFSASLTAEEELFMRSISQVHFVADKAITYKLRVGMTYFLTELYSGTLRFKGEGSGFLPVGILDYKTDFGYGFTPSLIWTRRIKPDRLFETSLGYSYLIRNTEMFKQTEQEILLKVGLIWEL